MYQYRTTISGFDRENDLFGLLCELPEGKEELFFFSVVIYGDRLMANIDFALRTLAQLFAHFWLEMNFGSIFEGSNPLLEDADVSPEKAPATQNNRQQQRTC